MDRIYIILQEKKGGRGAEYESFAFAFGFDMDTAEILNTNRSHLHLADTDITRISDTNDSHLHLRLA